MTPDHSPPPPPPRRLPGAPAGLSRRRFSLAAVAAPLLAGALGACGYGSQRPDSAAEEPAAGSGPALSVDELRIGYFANITHGTALVGLAPNGAIREELGGTAFAPQVFNAGPSAIEALNANAIDMTFVGPNPAINGYTQSGGRNLRTVCGAASGGAALVAHPDRLDDLADLPGKRIATPELGNTQDIAFLGYLRERGLRVDAESGRGDVTVLRIPNGEIPAALAGGDIDGAWVPQPTVALLHTRGAETLLDEGELWDDGRYVVTQVVVRQDFLADHPDVVEAVVRGVVRTNAWITENPEDAKPIVNDALRELTTQSLPDEVFDPAFAHVEFVHDPLAATLRASAETAAAVGLLDDPDLSGIYDLGPLNTVLAQEGLPEITDDAGLGV